MTRRTLVLFGSVVLSIALVAPGIAQEGDGPKFDPVATISKAGFKKTRKLAKSSNKRLNALEVASAQVSNLVEATAPIGSYQALGGPSVTVEVPDSGLVEVWGQAEVRDDDGGTVALFADGQKVPGISDPGFCGDDSVLMESFPGGPGEFANLATPSTFGIFGCTGTGAPAPMLVQVSPGNRTFEMRYSECVCGPGTGSDFRHRVLRVAARP